MRRGRRQRKYVQNHGSGIRERNENGSSVQ